MRKFIAIIVYSFSGKAYPAKEDRDGAHFACPACGEGGGLVPPEGGWVAFSKTPSVICFANATFPASGAGEMRNR